MRGDVKVLVGVVAVICLLSIGLGVWGSARTTKGDRIARLEQQMQVLQRQVAELERRR